MSLWEFHAVWHGWKVANSPPEETAPPSEAEFFDFLNGK